MAIHRWKRIIKTRNRATCVSWRGIDLLNDNILHKLESIVELKKFFSYSYYGNNYCVCLSKTKISSIMSKYCSNEHKLKNILNTLYNESFSSWDR